MTDNSLHLEKFRQEVRQFLASAVPEDIKASTRSHALVTREQAKRWQQILHQKGWAAPSWPQRYGGTGWSLGEQAIFKEELAASDAPHAENLGIDTIGPTLMRFGTAEHCERFLGRMLSFEDYWAQGYSEPEAGSDLAALKTSAVWADQTWVLNGSKIWQSLGHWANWAIVLARSHFDSAKKQEGISVFLVDLTAPGVTVRPIQYMHGAPFHVQIFFDNVQVPADQLVGEVNGGWAIAKGLLVIERLFVARVAECKAALAKLQANMDRRLASGRSHLNTSFLCSRLAALQIRGEALESCWKPAIALAEAGGSPSLEASLLKLDGIELLQDIHLLDMDLRGNLALRLNAEALQGLPAEYPEAVDGNAALGFWRYRGSSLAGGSTEIQLGIVAKTLLQQRTPLHQVSESRLAPELAMLLDSLNHWLQKNHSFELRQKELTLASEGSIVAAMSDFGVLTMGLPERLEGLGRPMADLIRVNAVLAESLLLEPVLWQHLLPLHFLQMLAPQPHIDAMLLALSTGESKFAVWLEDGDVPDAVCLKAGEGWQLSVQAPLVMGSPVGAGLLLIACEQGSTDPLLFCLSPEDLQRCADEGSLQAYRLHDGRPAFSIKAKSIVVTEQQLLAKGEHVALALQDTRSLANLALCAESIGICRLALRQTADYLGTRKQFSRPLADFQVLQHRLADLFRQWHKAHCYLECILDQEPRHTPAERWRQASKLKYLAGVAGRRIALDVLQLHGAIGFQDETPISHLAKRVFNNDLLLGSSEQHLARLLEAHI